jgi:hypothetical protein
MVSRAQLNKHAADSLHRSLPRWLPVLPVGKLLRHLGIISIRKIDRVSASSESTALGDGWLASAVNRQEVNTFWLEDGVILGKEDREKRGSSFSSLLWTKHTQYRGTQHL